jgi:hypothetical protein
VWTAPLLTSGLFVLAAFFGRAAISALTTLATLAHVAFMILAALLIASRLVVLLITAWRLLAAALLTLVATLLSEILVFIVCHIYSSRMFVIEISCAWNKSAARV